MPSALVAFDASYGGDVVHIAKGEIVSDAHELVRRFPAYFRSASSGRVPPRLSHSLRAAARPAGTTPHRIELSRAARDEIEELVAGFDGREVAAGLFGHEERGTIVIDDVVPSSEWAWRTSSFVEIERDRYVERDARYAARGLPQRFLGDLHIHPDGSPAKPSDTDRRGWSGSVRSAHGFYVGAIASLRRDENDFPWIGELNFWVAASGGAIAAAEII